MRRWKSQSSIGSWIGVLLLLALVGAAVALISRLSHLVTGPPESWRIDLTLYSQAMLLLGVVMLIGVVAYRVAAAFTLGYELDRNGLYITWLGNRAVVPLDQVQSVDVGIATKQSPWRLVQGIGVYWGQTHTSDDRLLYQFATRSPKRSLAIHTPQAIYAISPADTNTFVQELELRRNLGATKPLASSIEPGWMFTYAFWNDHVVRILLLVAFVINLLILALLAARYPALSPMVKMRFDATGQTANLQPRHQVLFLPLAAFGLSLLNVALGLLLYRRQQLGARLLQATSILVQVLFGIAVATIIR